MANRYKIITFALFIVTLLSSVQKLSSMPDRRLVFGSYVLIYDDPDSLLVTDLVDRVKEPIKKIETFFGYRTSSLVTIYVARSDAAYRARTHNSVPEWSQAVAHTGERLIVLKIASAEDIKNAPQVLLHELAHIYTAERIPAGRIPGWLNEGLADYLSGDRPGVDEKVQIANALATSSIIDLTALDSLLTFNPVKARLAYIQAYTAVEFFIEKHDIQNLRLLIRNLGKYHSVNDAFLQTVGYDFLDFELFWYEDLYKKYRWLVVLNLDNFIWVTMAVLALSAIIVIRYRNRKKLQEWDKSEPLA